MKIEQVYATSKGYFWTLKDAEKSRRRCKMFDERGFFVDYDYEKIKTAYVLIEDIKQFHNAIERVVETKAFLLPEIDLK